MCESVIGDSVRWSAGRIQIEEEEEEEEVEEKEGVEEK